jgi:outer membrane protein TolC
MKVNLTNTAAQKVYTQTNILFATNRLKYAMGLDFNTSIQLKDSISNPNHPSMPLLENVNIVNRVDYRIKQQNLLLQEIDLKRKRAAVLPVLTAYGQYGLLGYGTSVSMMLERSQQFDFAAIGFKLNIPLFNGLKKSSQIQQSKLTLDNATENLKLNENEYALEIQNFNTQLLSSYTALQTNKNNLDLAKDVFKTTSFQYENSAATLSDLLNSDYAYKEAQTNYLTSLLGYLTARIDLEKSNGTLKQYSNQL